MTKQTPHLKIVLTKLKTLIYTIVAPIWSAITFVNNTRTISIWPAPQTTNASFLQPYFFRIKSTFIRNSTKPKLNTIVASFLFRTNLRYFSNKVTKNLMSLWPASGLKSSEILNISKKIFKIKLFICNISNSSLGNLTQSISQWNKYYVDTFIRVSHLPLNYKLMKKARTWIVGTI